MLNSQYKHFTLEEWGKYPKDNFDAVIRSWCSKHNFIHYVEVGRPIAAKLPYHPKDGGIEVALDFLDMADMRRKLSIL